MSDLVTDRNECTVAHVLFGETLKAFCCAIPELIQGQLPASSASSLQQTLLYSPVSFLNPNQHTFINHALLPQRHGHLYLQHYRCLWGPCLMLDRCKIKSSIQYQFNYNAECITRGNSRSFSLLSLVLNLSIVWY